MAKVYVVQLQHRFDRERGELVPKFDLSPAEQHGELVYLLSPTAAPWTPEKIIPELRHKLRDFTDDDHLLLVGNPVLIGWAVAVASHWNEGRVACLQWSGKDKRYTRIEARLPI
jgi:hypothetical protein